LKKIKIYPRIEHTSFLSYFLELNPITLSLLFFPMIYTGNHANCHILSIFDGAHVITFSIINSNANINGN